MVFKYGCLYIQAALT